MGQDELFVRLWIGAAPMEEWMLGVRGAPSLAQLLRPKTTTERLGAPPMARNPFAVRVLTRDLSDVFPVRPQLRVVWSAENADPPAKLQCGAPEHLVAYRRGYMLATAGQSEKALVEYRSAIQKKPDFAEAYNGIGCALLQLGEKQAAIDAWREAIAIKPSFVEALYNLGSTQMRPDDDKILSEAITHLQAATELKHDLADGYFNLGMALNWNNQPMEASVALRKAVILKFDDVSARFLLGITLVFARQFPEAVAELSRTIDVVASNPVAHHMLGIALYETGKPEASLIEYQKTIEIEQDYPDIYLNIGASLSALGRWSDAAEAYRKAIEKDPNIAARQQMEAYIEWVDRNNQSVTIGLGNHILIDLNMSEAKRLYAEARKLGFTADSAIETLQAAAEAARETMDRAKQQAAQPAAKIHHQQTAPEHEAAAHQGREEELSNHWNTATAEHSEGETMGRAKQPDQIFAEAAAKSSRRNTRHVFTEAELRNSDEVNRARDTLSDIEISPQPWPENLG